MDSRRCGAGPLFSRPALQWHLPQIPLHFQDLSTFALELETAQLVQALKRISTLAKRGEWIHLQYRLGLLVISSGDASVDLRASGSWPQVISVPRSWAPALLRYPLASDVTLLRVENGKLYAQDLGIACIAGEDPRHIEEAGERERHIAAAAAALARYGVTPQEVEELLHHAEPDTARLWGPGDDKIIRDVATAWQCVASYGVETSAIRQLLNRKSRALWKLTPKPR